MGPCSLILLLYFKNIFYPLFTPEVIGDKGSCANLVPRVLCLLLEKEIGPWEQVVSKTRWWPPCANLRFDFHLS